MSEHNPDNLTPEPTPLPESTETLYDFKEGDLREVIPNVEYDGTNPNYEGGKETAESPIETLLMGLGMTTEDAMGSGYFAPIETIESVRVERDQLRKERDEATRDAALNSELYLQLRRDSKDQPDTSLAQVAALRKIIEDFIYLIESGAYGKTTEDIMEKAKTVLSSAPEPTRMVRVDELEEIHDLLLTIDHPDACEGWICGLVETVFKPELCNCETGSKIEIILARLNKLMNP